MVPGNGPIAGYCNPEINRFPGNNSRGSAESQNKKTLEKNFLQLQGIVNRRSIDFQVTIPSDWPITRYYYPNVGKQLGNDSWRSADCRVLLPENHYKKNFFSQKRKYF